MLDLTEELHNLVHLYRTRADRRRGAVLAFVSARSGRGVSTNARAFSRLIAPNSIRGVWLFDLDFYINNQFATFASKEAAELYGRLGQAMDPTLGRKPFWDVSPELVRKDGKRVSSAWYLAIHQVGLHRLFVSRFRTEGLSRGQSVRVRRAANYWQQVRNAIDLAVLDVPAFDRSRAVLALAADVDGVVLVADPVADEAETLALQQEIEQAGGRCLGVILNAGHQQSGPSQFQAQM